METGEMSSATALRKPEGKSIWCEACGQYHQSRFSPTANPCRAHLTERDADGGLVPCGNAAAYGPGSTVCPKHGIGYRDKPGGRPLVPEKYAGELSPTLRRRIEKSLNDPDLLSLREDIAVVEAVMAGRLAGFGQDGGTLAPNKAEAKEWLNLLAAKRKLSDAERMAVKDAKAFVTHREADRLVRLLIGIWVGIIRRELAGQPEVQGRLARELGDATAGFLGRTIGR